MKTRKWCSTNSGNVAATWQLSSRQRPARPVMSSTVTCLLSATLDAAVTHSCAVISLQWPGDQQITNTSLFWLPCVTERMTTFQHAKLHKQHHSMINQCCCCNMLESCQALWRHTRNCCKICLWLSTYKIWTHNRKSLQTWNDMLTVAAQAKSEIKH